MALYAAGQEAYNKSRLDDAVKSFEGALGLMPKYARAHRALAIALAKQNKAADAVEHYRTYLELDPKANDAAQVRKIVDDYEKAKAAGTVKPPEEKKEPETPPKGKHRKK
jgi:tetratricopeptide (TPR) repeat protein